MKMTPKEKAFELIDKYSLLVPIEFGGMDKNLAKQCALIAVDEILNSRKEQLVQSIKFYEYWTEVKRENKQGLHYERYPAYRHEHPCHG